MDHVYNTPRAWIMGRYLCPASYTWDGPSADFTPESDFLPWSLVPDRKVAVEDVKYLLSLHYQGTDYDPYTNRDTGKRGMYRSIGINRTGVTSICQIRSNVPDEIKGVEWIIFGSTTFSAAVPVYTNVDKLPDFVSKVTLDVSTDNLYWSSRLLAIMADANYSAMVQMIERYQNAVAVRSRQILRTYDRQMTETKDFSLAKKANDEICKMAKEETVKTLNVCTLEASQHMKNGYNLADN